MPASSPKTFSRGTLTVKDGRHRASHVPTLKRESNSLQGGKELYRPNQFTPLVVFAGYKICVYTVATPGNSTILTTDKEANIVSQLLFPSCSLA